MKLCALLVACLSLGAGEPFEWRGYYLTFMRMPVMGLPEWKQSMDCFAEDGANVVVLWMGGGFRSKKFPITWNYNSDHANVREDFARDLIDYARSKGIKVLLGFTPFGYDGVNRYALEHPELKARKADGSAVDEFGIHSWGWNLCPAQEESQRFMREYISEMVFDFYPNADGVLVESSDYDICRCKNCGAKFYDNEFRFVRWLSDELWSRKKNPMILVYPHYFTGEKVPGFGVKASRHEFDPRWALSFAPHSSHFAPDLMKQARANFYWSDSPALGTPRDIASASRAARRHGANGFVPSLEAFSYVAQRVEGGEPWLVGKRMRPFGLDPLGEGKMPFKNLLVRAQRLAFREFSKEPDLPFEVFKRRLGMELLGSEKADSLDDLLELQRVWNFERDWYSASPLLEPDLLERRARRLKWPAEKLRDYDRDLETLKGIAKRYEGATNSAEKELSRLASLIVERWKDRKPSEFLPK
jgi:hypothetical protein